MKLSLTIVLTSLILCSPVLADSIPTGAKLYFWRPVGNGDPKAVSCHVGRETPPYRFMDCKRNSDWARINAGFPSGLDSAILMPPSDTIGWSGGHPEGWAPH